MKHEHFFDTIQLFFKQILGLSFADDPELDKLYHTLRATIYLIMDHKEAESYKKINVVNNIISKLDVEELDFLLPILENHL